MHVTVVMSVLNGADYLERTIRDLYQQTYKDWDLIVVDDCSTDESYQILAKLQLQLPNLTLLRNETNRGLAYSLNLGWRAASGELIARADVDDENLPTRLEKQEKFMTEHPEVDVLGTSAYLIDQFGNPLGISARPESDSELKEKMYKETPFFHPSIMAKRSFFERFGGYNETIRYGQDSELWLRTYNRAIFHNLSEPLIRYRTRVGLPPIRAYWSVRILLLCAIREKKLKTKGWYALRYAISAILIWIGLKGSGARIHTLSASPLAPHK